MNNKITIFLVEDNPVFLLALKSDIQNTFEKESPVIHSFETGEACMKQFSVEKPQIVILDYNLNSNFQNAANGITVLDWIKKENPATHVIMLSSEDNLDVAVSAFRHGASDYVVKTETKFKKINYSLALLFKMFDAKNEAAKFKKFTFGALVCVGVFVLVAIVVGVFNAVHVR